MKSIILFIVIVLTQTISFAQDKKSFTIIGNLKKVPNGIKFYLIRASEYGGADTIQTQKSKDEKIRFEGSILKDGQLHFVKMDTCEIKLPKGRKSWVRLLLEDKNTILTGNIEEWPTVKIEGGESTILYEEHYTAVKKYEDRFRKAQINKDSLGLVDAKKDEAIFTDSFIRKNANSPSSALILLQESNFTELQKEELYNQFTRSVQNSYYGELVKMNSTFSTVRLTIKEEGTIPNFEYLTPGGSRTSIREAVKSSKYTLIDFWASWCVPCRNEIPNLKNIFNSTNRDSFNVISIAVNDNKKAWQKAYKEEDMPWAQGIDSNRYIWNLFNFGSIPAYILVDENGKLIAYQCALSGVKPFGGVIRGPELLQKVKTLLTIN